MIGKNHVTDDPSDEDQLSVININFPPNFAPFVSGTFIAFGLAALQRVSLYRKQNAIVSILLFNLIILGSVGIRTRLLAIRD